MHIAWAIAGQNNFFYTTGLWIEQADVARCVPGVPGTAFVHDDCMGASTSVKIVTFELTICRIKGCYIIRFLTDKPDCACVFYPGITRKRVFPRHFPFF